MLNWYLLSFRKESIYKCFYIVFINWLSVTNKTEYMLETIPLCLSAPPSLSALGCVAHTEEAVCADSDFELVVRSKAPRLGPS